MPKMVFPDLVWAGTEHSLMLAHEAYERTSQVAIERQAGTGRDEEEETPYNFRMQGDIGVVEIKGGMTNRDSWVNRYVGLISYADIRRGLIYAASRADVKTIVLDIDSGGGAVSGVADTANLIATIDSKVKPVYAISDGAMASAAYWVGSGARKVFLSNTAVMGSIGVIATHMEYSKMLKEAGVGVTVVRAGQYKALANSFEPLTEAAQKQLQDLLNGTYKVFIGWVADQRKVSADEADRRMGQGREFLGQDAVTAGLADGVESFDSMMSKLQRQLDKANSSNQNSVTFQRGVSMPKQALTEQEIAALAAGAPLVAATKTGAEPEGQPDTTKPAAEVPAQEDPAKPAAATPAAEVTEVKEEKDQVVGFLRAELKDRDSQLVTAKVELKQAQDKVASMEAGHTGLVAIAAASIKHMRVAMKLPAIDASGLSTEQILAEHKSLVDQFTSTFKAGGVAAVSSQEAAEVKADPHRKARVAATRI